MNNNMVMLVVAFVWDIVNIAIVTVVLKLICLVG